MTDYMALYIAKEDKNLCQAYESMFIDYIPRLLDVAIRNNSSRYLQRIFNHMDYVDFHFRRYLSGRVKTLHRVYSEIRSLFNFDDSENTTVLFYCCLIDIYQSLSKHELFELLPRFEKTKNKVCQLVRSLVKNPDSLLFAGSDIESLSAIVKQHSKIIKLNPMKKQEIVNPQLHLIENDEGMSFSVQKINPRLQCGEKFLDKILFMIDSILPEEDLTKDGELLLTLSKDEARNLAAILLEMANE